MKIRIKVSFAGLNFSYIPGDEPDVPDSMAREWIEIGYAERIVNSGPVEALKHDEKMDKSVETAESKQVKTSEKAVTRKKRG